jgi:TolB-like protein
MLSVQAVTKEDASMTAAAPSRPVISFGPFRLAVGARLLTKDGVPVDLGARALDILIALVSRPNEVVSKEDLLARVWPGVTVEESSLRFHMAGLRKALGDGQEGARYITTLPGRGYCFVAAVAASDGDALPAVAAAAQPVLALPDKPSIAVLPFQNMSGDPEEDYFADGIVEEIITGLARIRWLFVIARNSSFVYKGRAVDVKQVGRELGVRYVLEGSVRKAGTRVRTTGQLIDAENGAHLWAERYDRPLSDIFDLQDEITLSVLGAIEPSLRMAEIERVKRKRPENLDAYDLVLRAMPFAMTRMPAGAEQAIPLLKRAIGLDATYAMAHASLAWCYHTLYYRAGRRAEHDAASVRHARAVLDLGSDDATALSFAAFALAMSGERDYGAGLDLFDRAIALSPSSVLAWGYSAMVLAYAGRTEEAIRRAGQALRLSPFDWHSFVAHQALALAHFLDGRFEDSAAAARREVQVNPGFTLAHAYLAAALARLGRIDEARAAAKQVLALEPQFTIGSIEGFFPDRNAWASVAAAMSLAKLPD